MAPSRSNTGAELWWDIWSCAKLGQFFSTFQYPTHSGRGQPWFSSQLHVKVLNGEVGNSNAPSSASGPGLGKACGKRLWSCLVLAGCTAGGTRGMVCMVCPDSSHLRETSIRNLQALTLISHLSYAPWEQILGWLLFFLSSYEFCFEDEKGESSPWGRGTSTDICMSAIPAVTSICALRHNILLSWTLIFQPFQRFLGAFLSISVRCLRGLYRKKPYINNERNQLLSPG